MRDYKGHVLFAFSHFYGHTYNLVAEVRAVVDGLRYCVARGMNIEAVETDSCVLVQIINSGASVPWRITSWAAEIKSLLLQMHASIVHVVREGSCR